MNKYKTYLEMFGLFAEESFQVIYKDQIFAYSLNGQKIQGDELETAERNYVKLFFNICGPVVCDNLIGFYGERDILITNLVIFFQKKIQDDQIVKVLNDSDITNTR
jgi:hypothetical protein